MMSKQLKVFRVDAGLDCFVYETKEGERLYLAYFPVVAENEDEAKKVAQKIIDENPSDENAIFSEVTFMYNY